MNFFQENDLPPATYRDLKEVFFIAFYGKFAGRNLFTSMTYLCEKADEDIISAINYGAVAFNKFQQDGTFKVFWSFKKETMTNTCSPSLSPLRWTN